MDAIPDAARAGLFEQERGRLFDALGRLTAGGVVEAIEPLDAARSPQPLAAATLDIGLAVWPFPLDPARQAALAARGYAPAGQPEGAPEQRFSHTALPVQLFILEAGAEPWTDHLIVRDYLRHHPAAWSSLGGAPSDATPSSFSQPLLAAARQWWVRLHGFAPVERVGQALAGFAPSWHIASGWALDLFLGSVSRVHLDVDVVVPRAAQLDLQQFLVERGWQLLTPLDGRLDPWPPHMRLELPRHQVHAHRDGAFIDFLLTDIEPGIWRYRREPTILRAEARMGLKTGSGLPYLAPELTLLFKSQSRRAKDQADFERVHPHLDPERRAWLHWALVATAPDHPWLARLGVTLSGE
jgi:hypothetical protein